MKQNQKKQKAQSVFLSLFLSFHVLQKERKEMWNVQLLWSGPYLKEQLWAVDLHNP